MTPCHIVQVSNNAALDDVVGIIKVTDPDNYNMDPPVQSHNCSVGGEGLNIFTVDNEAMTLKVCKIDPPPGTVSQLQCRRGGTQHLHCRQCVFPVTQHTLIFCPNPK